MNLVPEAPLTAAKRASVRALAWITRRIQPRGLDRILFRIHDPRLRRWSIQSTIRIEDGTVLLVDTASWIEWRIFFFGAYEPGTLAVLRRCVRPGRTAIDVGANIGTHALAMAAAGAGRVVAYEPNPAVFHRLRQNLALNSHYCVDARAVAVGNKAGNVTLFEPVAGHNRGQASLLNEPGLQALTVPCVTLDGESLTEVDLIKIDIEGFEAPVLEGARDLLRSQRPVIVFEYNQPKWAAAGYHLDVVQRYLAGLGYTTFLKIGHRSLEAMPQTTPRFMNVFASDGRPGPARH